MSIKCKYCLFNAIIWGLVIAGIFIAYFDWLKLIPCNYTRIIISLILVVPVGAILQWLMLKLLGWEIVVEAEKPIPGSEDRSKYVPYQFAYAYGIAERCLYLVLFLAGFPEGIFLWLAFKAIAKWGQRQNTQEWVKSSPHNLSLIGEILNIFLVIAGVLIIKGNVAAFLKFLSQQQ